MIDGEEEIVRFIAIDTPELSSNDYYAKEASEETCRLLTKAQNIDVEKDPKADRDKYGRLIAWVYVDDVRIQTILVGGGYAKVRYIYADYLYLDELYQVESNAIKQNIGVWAK